MSHQLPSKITLTTQKKSTHTIAPGPDTNLFLDFAHWIREGRKPRMTADDALAITEFVLKARDAADRGEKVLLVRLETSPEDLRGMIAAEGILTARGGLVSHAAVVARGWGTPAVVGAEAIKIDGKKFTVGSVTVKEGDSISIDGTTGEVLLGEMKLAAAEPPAEFHTILKWADVVRKGKMGVRANADTGAAKLDEFQELQSRAGIVTKCPQHRARDGKGVLLFDPAHRHAQMGSLTHDGHAEWIEAVRGVGFRLEIPRG